MTDVPGEAGFDVGAAYVSVSPDAASFPEQLEEQIGEVNFVVHIPVVPDAGDFPGEVDAAVAESRATVQVPVVPDTEGFQLLIDNAVAEAKAAVTVPVVPDVAGLPEAIDEAVAAADKPVTIPVVPDMGGFAETAETEAAEAGQASGSAFSEKLAATVASGLNPVWPEAFAGAGPAGGEGGSLFGDEFAAAAEPRLSAMLGASAANIILPAGEAGGAAGAAFASQFDTAAQSIIPQAMVGLSAEMEGAGAAAGIAYSGRMLAVIEGSIPERIPGMIEGTIPAMESAGEEAGAGFFARFSGALGRMTAPLAALIPGMAAEGGEAGEAAGGSFVAKMKGVLTGDLPLMETALGAGFIAVTAVMASKFQSAMEMIHTQAGVGQSAIASLSNGVLALASKVGESPDSLASALYHVESSFQSVGISGKSALSLVQIAAEGARVGGADLVDVTNALDATIVAGVPGINSYSQAMGALNAIVGSGDMTMQNLADALGSGVMAVAKTYGQTIYQVGAALATLGDNNIRGAKAATDLRMAWQALQAPLTTAKPLLESIGLTYTQLGKTMEHQGMSVAVQQFVQHLEASKIPVADWGQYVTEIFGKRAGVGIGIFISQLDRLKGKIPDIKKGADDFGSAWQATQRTTTQALKEVESGVEALLIKIGDRLLPYVDQFLHDITKALPSIEHFGAAVGRIAAPFVEAFFTGLHAILKVLLGPLKDVTIAIAAVGAALLAVSLINPWVAIIAGVITLVGLIIKYHKQIWDVITKTWGDITHFFAEIADPIFKPVEKAFDDIKDYITSGFDKWWKDHGKQVEEVWKVVWTVIKDVFKLDWDYISTVAKLAWDAISTELKIGLDIISAIWKVTWDTISAYFKISWDVMAAIFKVAWDGISTTFKIAWDLIVGTFDIFLDLITGHWSKAWDQVQTTATQIWNAIKDWLSTAWNAIRDLAEQVWNAISTYFSQIWHDIYDVVAQIVNALKSFLVTAWDDIRNGVVGAFDDLRSDVKGVWDGILHDIEAVVDKIKSIVSDITGLPGKAVHAISGALGSIGLEGGGVLPGYAPGHDSINAKLSPGEAVLVPEAVRAIGPGRINAINAHYSAGRRGYSDGGIIPGFADGGMAPSGPASAMSGASQSGTSGGNNFYLTFNGARPTAEEWAAIQLKLTQAVAMA